MMSTTVDVVSVLRHDVDLIRTIAQDLRLADSDREAFMVEWAADLITGTLDRL